MEVRSLAWMLLSLTVHVAVGLSVVQRSTLRLAEASKPLEIVIVDGHDRSRAGSFTSGSSQSSILPRSAHAARQGSRSGPRLRSAPRRVQRSPTEEVSAELRASPAAVSSRTADIPAAKHGPSSAWLSPRAAALTEMAPHASETARGAEDRSPEEKLEQAIMAGTKPPIDQPPEPKLLPRPEGGYEYRGEGFQAEIARDGALTMKDRYGTVVLPLVPYRNRDGKWRVSPGFGGTFRLYEWLDKKLGKNDPYGSERRWFLEHTRELRERLWREHAPSLKHAHDADAG